jgi:anti-anti-sigma factor
MDPNDDPTRVGGIDVSTSKGCTLVRLWGEVDGALRADASTSMAQALVADQPILVDASGLSFIDSSGLAFLLQLHLAAAETGLHVTLRDPERQVVDRLALIGMDREFELENTVATPELRSGVVSGAMSVVPAP